MNKNTVEPEAEPGQQEKIETNPLEYQISLLSGPREGWQVTDYQGKLQLEAILNPPSGDRQLKSLTIVDTHKAQLMQVFHRAGESKCVTLTTPSGEAIGETTVSFGFCCCCVLKPKYVLKSPSGNDLLTLLGKISCSQMNLKIEVKSGTSKEFIGSVVMGDTFSFECRVTFASDSVTEYERNLLFALCIGMLDHTYVQTIYRRTLKFST